MKKTMDSPRGKNIATRGRIGLIIGVTFIGLGIALLSTAASTNFVQDDWSGGIAATQAEHPGNATGWTKYSSKDTYLNAGASGLTLSTESSSAVETNDTDFGAGTLTNAEISGTGTAATVKLTAATNWLR